MSTNSPSDRPARPKSKVKIGLQAEFEQMLSSLPGDGSELESETVSDKQPQNPATSRPAVGLQADFSQMLSGLPTAPEDSVEESAAEEDFRVKRQGPQFRKVALQRDQAEPEVESDIVAEPVAKATARSTAPQEASRETVEEDDFRAKRMGSQFKDKAPKRVDPEPESFARSRDGHAHEVEQKPAPKPKEEVRPVARKSDPEFVPPPNIFGIQEDEAAAYLRERETVVGEPDPSPRPSGKRPAATATTGFTPPPAEPDPASPASITDLILAELEKYSIPAVSQLRIAVHGGAVTIVGDVPGDYERQLIVHFCKKVPGVTEVTDMMRIVGGGEATPAAAAAAPAGKRASKSFAAVPRKAVKAKSPPRDWKPAGYTLQLPFRAKHVGVVAGLLAMVWAGFTFATRDGSRLSVSQVTGKVLVDGAPAEGASVVFHPVDPNQQVRPRGSVGADGTFKLTTYLPGDGAPSGDYKVTVEWCKIIESPQGEPMPGPNLLPAEWSKPETTIHKVTVSGSTEVPPFQVTK